MRHRIKPRKSARRVVPFPSLRRLPGDFSWELLSLLRKYCSAGSPEESDMLDGLLRKRQPTSYHQLRELMGLQSKTLNGRGSALAGRLLLAYMCKKDLTLETASSSERKETCIRNVIQIDESLSKVKVHRDDPVFLEARTQFRRIAGTVPGLEDIAHRARHGPGSTVHITREHQSSYFKYADWPYRVNAGAQDLLRSVIQLDHRWMGALEDSYRHRNNIPMWCILDWSSFWGQIIVPCNYNRITTVPKDGTKDRPIAVEPEGNVYLQLGIESVLRDRLKLFGVNLDSQERNQELARIGSIDSSWISPATVDLSNASDTISLSLLEFLADEGWFSLLVSTRSPYGLLPDGTALRYAKVSSMGNGYTFVLESLIFYSFICAYSKLYGHPSDLKRCSVFGDDLIFPRYLAIGLLPYLELAGFTINRSKSFLDGPVRESCGKDFVSGIDYRPVFVPERIEDVMDLICLRNRLNRWFCIHTGCYIPLEVDNFFLKYIDNLENMPIGPESDTEFDTYWHDGESRWPEFVYARCLTRRMKQAPAREFMFRKLMHSLRYCEGDGGRFRVTIPRTGTISWSQRVLYRGYYLLDKVRQDHARPRSERIS